MSEFAPLMASSYAYLFAGFAVGLVVSLTGVRGGSVMTPLLIFGFGNKPHVAIGTDLLFAAFAKLGGTISLARHRLIDWPDGFGRLAVAGQIAGRLTARQQAGRGTHETNPRPDHSLALVRLAGLR